ncbi:M28 family peptidase [Belnapia sp. T6]|uniref:Carboxypeptidase Q n=1 Tax=Belnapia mucosa TaxID=2804532 RepID=A0ABS1V1J8_9PROT|nr:M28 family peptidase [Belnapia mucosa]MBL6455579.1 M28 family peptidase [Belnapia mucosa]
MREEFLAALRADAPRLEADFAAICGCGGRLQGTPSADTAFALVRELMAPLGPVEEARTRFHGWTLEAAAIALPNGTPIPCASLVGSVPTEEREWEVVDCGRGAPADIAAAGDRVRGRAVMLRHEYAFSPGTIHRRVKLRAAAEAGAAAVLMVQPVEGLGPVAGGANSCPVPGFGIGIEGARALLAAGRGRFRLAARHHPAAAANLLLDLPGGGPGRVVLSAHLDGHMLAESAIDNATGVAALLSLGRAVAPFLLRLRRGLLLAVFGAEEWSLSGSRAWLATLPAEARAGMAMNLNLDSIAGSPNLAALTSGFPALGPFVRAAAGEGVRIHQPISVSSDHANFAAQGIPALRLLAGFDEPECGLSRLLTAGDTRDRIAPGELQRATEVAGAILWRALSAERAEMAALRDGAEDVGPAVSVLAPLP